MYARVTHFEVDTVAISIPNALKRFEELILPPLRAHPGYKGLTLLTNAQGRGMLLTFWETEEAANAGLASGFWDEQISKFVTFYRQQPEREQFEVLGLEAPVAVALAGNS